MRVFPLIGVDMPALDQKLLDHFLNPRNAGEIDNPDGYGRAVNPVNQYFTDIYLRGKAGRIDDIKFKTFGCVVTIASASALTGIVKGKSIDEILDSKNPLQDLLTLIHKELGVVPEKNWHCPPAAIQALLVAFSDYYQRNNDEKRLTQLAAILKEVQCLFESGLRNHDSQKDTSD
jgi:nitrogen fixation NifU-like protein